MRPITIGMLAAIAATGFAMTVSTADAQSCYDLWVQRNSVYKEAGYCFKTPRAIRYFGNAPRRSRLHPIKIDAATNGQATIVWVILHYPYPDTSDQGLSS